MPETTREIAVRYIRPGAPACDVVLPAGTRLARLDDGLSVEYVVADPAILRSLAPAYNSAQPYCFVPEEVASEPARPGEGRAVAVEPSLMAAWSEATYGFFDPASHWVDRYGNLPGPGRTGAGCRAMFGQPIPAERRRWEDGDYSLRTDVDGLLLQVRPRSPENHGRRLGYAMTPVLARAIDREIAAHREATGEKLETWEMPSGSLARRCASALGSAVDALAVACSVERLPELGAGFPAPR